MLPLKIDLFPTLCIGLTVRRISQRGIMTLHLILLREFDYSCSLFTTRFQSPNVLCIERVQVVPFISPLQRSCF